MFEHDFTQRIGETHLDSVEFKRCSQEDNQHGGLRFELAAAGAPSTVTNCSIHSGIGWGVLIRSSTDVTFNENFVVGALQGGLVI
jgi:hypothetical protein